ncbi:MAG: hypothetical protein HDT37_00550 [Clostridiales bacterium]|nr:hypothetical protein [Clostridiales bacterium]
MTRKIDVKCPYCGRKVTVEHDGLYADAHIATCDFMDGGCDRMFVADVKVSMTATARKIEGEAEKVAEG